MPIFCQIWYRTFLGANQNCNCRFHDHDGQSLQILYTEQTHYIHVTFTKILQFIVAESYVLVLEW